MQALNGFAGFTADLAHGSYAVEGATDGGGSPGCILLSVADFPFERCAVAGPPRTLVLK